MQITPLAIKHLVETRDRKGLDAETGARFAPGSSGISVAFGRSPQPGDKKIDGGEIEIYVANALVERFDQALIDVASRDKEKALVIRADPFATPPPL